MPLSGIRVLDLSRLLPGPYATRLLAELGAEVLKIEDPRGGDPTRWAPSLAGDPAGSALFEQLNRGKKSIALDLKREDGRAAVRALARTCDVLVDSFRPGVLVRAGLDPTDLARQNPKLIYCAMTGFGLTGPDRARVGHDLGFIARAGALGLSGPPDHPVSPGFQVADIGAAFVAVSGILAALLERARTGRGRVVDISLTEAALAFNAAGIGLMKSGDTPRRGRAMLDGSRPCYGVYRARDGFLAVGALEPKFWSAFVGAIGLPELESSGFEVGEAAEAVRARVEARLGEKTRAEWTALFREVEACVEPVLDLDELEADAQHVERGVFDGTGVLRSPIRLGDFGAAPGSSATRTLSPAPALGQHTESALREAGVDAELIRQLLEM